MTDIIVVIDSINFCSLSSARFSLSSSFAANSFSNSSLLSCSFACASSTSFTSEVAAFSARCTLVILFLFFFATGISSSVKLGVEGRLLAEEPGVERCLLTAGVDGQLLTAGPGVDKQLLTAGLGVVGQLQTVGPRVVDGLLTTGKEVVGLFATSVVTSLSLSASTVAELVLAAESSR